MYSSGSDPQAVAGGPSTVAAAPKQPRGADRRLLLLQTTLRLIATEGIDAVSHRSVAEHAGVPLGSTTYWFDSRQDMLRQALEYFARLELDTMRNSLAGVLGKRLSRRRLVDQFTAHMVAQLGEQRWSAMAQYALLNEAARQPKLQNVCREWNQAWRDLLAEVFTSLGAPDAELEATMFLAMLDGLLLAQLAVPDEDAEHSLIRPALKAWFERVPSERPR
jgi:DNA-binding transcriptional regulator YbjK